MDRKRQTRHRGLVSQVVHTAHGLNSRVSIVGDRTIEGERGPRSVAVTQTGRGVQASPERIRPRDVEDSKTIPSLAPQFQEDLEALFPQAIVNVRVFVMGPSTGSK